MTIWRHQGQKFWLPSATKLRRLFFYKRVSVHRGGVPDQVHPQTRSPQTSYTPSDQVHPPDQVPPQTRYTPGPSTPPQTRYTPLDKVPPRLGTPPRPGTPRPGTPPRIRYPPAEIRPLLRTVRILLECILVYLSVSTKS